MRTLTIDERDFATKEELMSFLANSLEFPSYFGGNLAALHDCLGDLDEPTRIRIRRRTPDPGSWFERITTTMLRTACENDHLSVRVKA